MNAQKTGLDIKNSCSYFISQTERRQANTRSRWTVCPPANKVLTCFGFWKCFMNKCPLTARRSSRQVRMAYNCLKKRRGWGGGGAAPLICNHNARMIALDRECSLTAHCSLRQVRMAQKFKRRRGAHTGAQPPSHNARIIVLFDSFMAHHSLKHGILLCMYGF